MKKIVAIILIISCIACMVACRTENLSNHSSGADHLENGQDTSENENTQVSSNSNTENLVDTPPDQCTYHFDSYSELLGAVSKKDTEDYAALRNELDKCSAVYQKTLSLLSSGSTPLAVPQIDKKAIPLRQLEGYPSISFMTCELYNLPWIWYHCIVNGNRLDVRISYVDAIEAAKFSSEASYYDILSVLAPSAPTPDNYEQYPSYQSIYQSELTLSGGYKTMAMISEIKDSAMCGVMFRYDDLLVYLYGDDSIFTSDFWTSFHIGGA